MTRERHLLYVDGVRYMLHIGTGRLENMEARDDSRNLTETELGLYAKDRDAFIEMLRRGRV